MNLRLLLCIVMGVFVAHIGVFMLLAQLRPKPKLTPPPKPNFSAKATVVVNAETGEKTIFREITVSTKFAPDPTPAPPEKLPPPGPRGGEAEGRAPARPHSEGPREMGTRGSASLRDLPASEAIARE